MISPKYANSHAFYPLSHFKVAPTQVNLYLDYNCPFSAKIFFKFKQSVIPQLESKNPGKFQFNFMNVIQPWHSNSNYLHEFSLSIAKLIREKELTSEIFWSVSESLFKNIKQFSDNANSDKGRNQIYSDIYESVIKDVDLPFSKEEVLKNVQIPQVSSESDYDNSGNAVVVDTKYFTRFQRTVGVHITPTVSINGIENGGISSGSEPEELAKILESAL